MERAGTPGGTVLGRRRFRLGRLAFGLAVVLVAGAAWGQGAPGFEERRALFQAGDYRRALELFLRAVDESPYEPERRLYLAETYEHLEDFPAAMQQYRHILRLAPRSSAAAAARDALRALGEPTQGRIEVPFRRSGSSIVLAARLNGRDVGSFILDTGATFTIISRAAAASLGLPAGDRLVRLATASGTVDAPLAMLREVEVGGAVAADVQAVIHDVPDLPPSIAGLLGLSFLERFRINLDMGSGLLILETQD
jgi:clan AA aspartic protease (TIGR02281 family)